MSVYFFDSSGLVKRYMPETGTRWVREQTSSHSQNNIVIAQITVVEIVSALSRHYHDGNINLNVFQSFRRLLLQHEQTQYQTIALSQQIVAQALVLHETYRLRAYDAVQLSTCLQLSTRLSNSTLTLTFVSADVRLLQAATSEGLNVENPNNYI